MNPRDAASWFVRELRRQSADRSLVSQGKKIDLYFDASYVRDATVGVQAFFPPPHYSFHADTFRSARTLVQCLFSAGWLGSAGGLGPPPAGVFSLSPLRFLG